jgi:hypothetical protein
MRTVKILGLIAAIFTCLAALVTLMAEGVKLYNSLPTQTPISITISTTTPTLSLQVAQQPQLTSTSAPNLSCVGATELGPWAPINGQGQDVYIDSGDGYVHAVLWRPGGPQLKAGYDEVSVLIEPGTKVTFIDVAGTAYKYYASCSKAYVEAQIERLNNEKIQSGGTIITVSISELQTR